MNEKLLYLFLFFNEILGRGGTQPFGSRGFFVGRSGGMGGRLLGGGGLIVPLLAIGLGAFVAYELTENL